MFLRLKIERGNRTAVPIWKRLYAENLKTGAIPMRGMNANAFALERGVPSRCEVPCSGVSVTADVPMSCLVATYSGPH